MAEGSVSEFTLWMGPLPVRWRAVHSQVDNHGFTDTQERGLMAHWQHTHRFESLDDQTTQVREHIEYQHHRGWRGALSRLLFGSPALRALFIYRRWATRQALRNQ
jgi:ligand-binding SRPBCC domain-containing protein